MLNRQSALVDVRVIVIRDDAVLLIRLSAGEFTGRWNLPGGHVRPGEDVVSAAVREVNEEIGLTVRPEHLTFSSVTQHRPPTRSEKVTFTFTVREFDGEPVNAEPDKVDACRWTPLDDLPAVMMPQAEASLRLFLGGQPFATYGL